MNIDPAGPDARMGRLRFGRLTEAWTGEASDFTPLLSERLDQLGEATGVNLASVGRSEVASAGGRRIDIVAQDADGAEFVIENQYGRADHDHLTRGLAYAVASRARGLVVVAEEHRDEFKAVARYLNDLAESDTERGIAVWLVEARAVRIDDSAWAPIFTAVVEPNEFVTTVEQEKPKRSTLSSLDEFWDLFEESELQAAASAVVGHWIQTGFRTRLGPNHVVLEAEGPSKNGYRTVVVLYADGRVMVPFNSYAGSNSGIEIESLTTDEFRQHADALFGFNGTEQQARTVPGWLTPSRVEPLDAFCERVAEAYHIALRKPV
ncbi:hypothetical protein [Myceligenerans indicum]|uniref:DUF4268 domain-containing protein n=1 Tax=Myceligenerans indicum TaxID=2593663 RepID=A0ABS1LPV5_9MICO|nr:hypothetical protein [Myceligenerans indicum]MBL0888301.1 hypothetical protein [Myceligenerans indicum]